MSTSATIVASFKQLCLLGLQSLTFKERLVSSSRTVCEVQNSSWKCMSITKPQNLLHLRLMSEFEMDTNTPNKLSAQGPGMTMISEASRGSSIPASLSPNSNHKKQLSSECFTRHAESTASSKKPNFGLLKKTQISLFTPSPASGQKHSPDDHASDLVPTVLEYDTASPASTHQKNKPQLPQLPAIKSPKQLTLYVDLDETLVHFETDGPTGQDLSSGHLHVRPYASNFLQELSKVYELVIFTAGTAEYAEEVVHELDPQRIMISHILSREWTEVDAHHNYVKNLAILGRPLTHVLLVDNCCESFSRQPENGVLVNSWTSSDSIYDTALLQLIPLLKRVAERWSQSPYPDIRQIYADLASERDDSSDN